MAEFSNPLQGLDLDALFAEGLREATRQAPVPWEPPAPADLAGVLPGYEIVRLIGRGGMGAVYEARQVGLDRRVAIKVLPAELGANEAFAERFRREARALGRLKHAHILDVHEFGESSAGHLFFSMDYVAGGDLGARLKSGPLQQGEALRLVKEICAALEAAHAQGVIHRDIKPSNILLTADGSVKVADFGLAIHADQPEARLTRSGVTFGTFEYAAPEMAAGTAVDPRSDLFSLGVICYELLTGTLPRGFFDPPSKVNASVDPAMDEVVQTAMQNDPARRYQTATDFRAALHRTESPRMRPARRWPAAIIAALVLLAVGAALFHWWPGRPADSPPPVVEASPVTPPPAIRSTIVSWGQNDFGEGTAPANLGKVEAIAAGDGFTAALKDDGTVAAWGRHDKGQTNVPAGLTGVQSIAAGAYHVLGLKADGTVVAWGADWASQATVPAGLSDVQAIAAGNAFSMALKRDGTVVAWGDNEAGQTDVPAGLNGVKAIAAAASYALALKSDGTVAVWGRSATIKTLPGDLAGVRAIAAGWHHALALKTDGTVVAWGSNSDGLTDVPAGLTGVQVISAGLKHSLALKADGTVVAWGVTGRESWGDRCGQTEVPAGLAGVKAIAAGFRHSVALK